MEGRYDDWDARSPCRDTSQRPCLREVRVDDRGRVDPYQPLELPPHDGVVHRMELTSQFRKVRLGVPSGPELSLPGRHGSPDEMGWVASRLHRVGQQSACRAGPPMLSRVITRITADPAITIQTPRKTAGLVSAATYRA